jgi:hypothetical protein
LLETFVTAVVFTQLAACYDALSPCREFLSFFSIMYKGVSFMANASLARFLPNISSNASAAQALVADPGFQESNLMHSING